MYLVVAIIITILVWETKRMKKKNEREDMKRTSYFIVNDVKQKSMGLHVLNNL